MFENRGNQARLALSLKSLPASQHLIEHDAQGEDVRPSIGVFSFELLGSHVLKSAEDGSFLG